MSKLRSPGVKKDKMFPNTGNFLRNSTIIPPSKYVAGTKIAIPFESSRTGLANDVFKF